jgi:hypothetical protein
MLAALSGHAIAYLGYSQEIFRAGVGRSYAIIVEASRGSFRPLQIETCQRLAGTTADLALAVQTAALTIRIILVRLG